MSWSVVEEGDSLQIRATISDAEELGDLIAKLESRRNGWKAESPSDGAIYSAVNRSMFSKEQNEEFDKQMKVAEKVMLHGKDVLKELGDE